MEPRIPTVFAVGLWVASGLAVLTYTFIAFKETATGVEAAGMIVGEAANPNPLIAAASVLAAEMPGKEVKPMDRGKFKRKSPGG